MARPDGRQIWVNFALPDNHQLQVIDSKDLKIVKTLSPGKAVLHMEFTPRGEDVWVSVRDDNQVLVYDTGSLRFKKNYQLQNLAEFSFFSGASTWVIAHAESITKAITDNYQQDFPLSPTPFQDIAETLGVSEQEVIVALQELNDQDLSVGSGRLFHLIHLAIVF